MTKSNNESSTESKNISIDVIQNKNLKTKFVCEHTCPEITSLCPYTGMPDFYSLIIRYIPNLKLVELKSLKIYLVNFRNRGIFHEELLNEVFDDFKKTVEPNWLFMELVVNNRGGIFTSVKREWSESTGEVTR